MKWLKKDTSDDDQKKIAESQPEQPSEVYPNPDAEPETLEQPEEAMTGAEEPQEELEFLDNSPQDFEEPEPVEALPVESRRRGGRRRDKINEDPLQKEEKAQGFNPIRMISDSWIGNNWKIVAILLFIFCMALFVRSYYGVTPATENGFILSGGSDSYYHNYVIENAIDTGDHHFWDNMLNYPVGTRNPRPPLYDWSVSIGGIALSPFFGDGVYESTFYVFLFSTAFWGALTVFPTYFLAKEAFGRRTGVIAAFLLAIMPGHIQRSVLTNADHDAMALFFIVSSFFFFLKALKVMKQKEWVSTWRKPEPIFNGFRELLNENKVSILYAVMSGLSLAGVALIWKGYAYAIIIMSAYFFIQLLLNKFRNVDSLGVLAVYFVSVGVGLLIAFPYYYQSIQVASWFDTPTYVLFGASAFALALIVTRRFPWVLVFSSMIGIGVLFTLLLAVVAPALLDTLVSTVASGAGYFIQNKQYQTIAEAQAPPFSNLAMSFGIITFWLSFIGIAWAAIQLPKTWNPDFTFILLWTATSIYMAVTAARFMFNAGPAFAITAGWVVALLLSKIDVKKFSENLKRASQPYMSNQFRLGILISSVLLILLSAVLYTISNAAAPVFVIGMSAIIGIYLLNLISETNPSKIYNLITILIPVSGAIFYILSEFYTDWEFNTATHGFILFIMIFAYFVLYMTVRRTSFTFTAGIVFLSLFIIMPNVWGGLDAGIPYEVKNDYDLEIYETAPIFMQSSKYDSVNGSSWFLGGFGYSLPLNSRYWPAAYDWLATQDEEIYPAWERPAFLSWWDYGFEVVNEGKHPTVADNFLGGHQLAGNFIMSQSEGDAIALLTARILEGNWRGGFTTPDNGFDPEVESLVQSYGVDVDKLNDYFDNPGDYTDEILAHPEIYGPKDDVIQDANARYILIRVLLTDTLDLEEIVGLYNDLCDITGDSIRYFGIDSRLFPFSADNTGIFYAPAKLSDHRIDEIGNQPYDFWEIKAVGEFGGEYDLDEIPPDVSLNPDKPYKIVYKDMFYNSMLYKCFIGYSGEDVGRGEDAGIPGLSGSMTQDPIMPGWNMTHFKLEHRTAYWNPYGADEIQNHTDAWQAMNYRDAFEKQQAGEGIADLSDRSSLYQGVMMLKYYDGAIVSGKVTLEDGTPVSGVSVTVADEFSIPHERVMTDEDGSYSIIVPYGDIRLTASIGTVDPMSLVGSEMNVTEMHIEDYQAMREEEDRDNDGKPDYLISQDLVIKSGSLSGVTFMDSDGDETYSESIDTVIQEAKITLANSNIEYEVTTYSNLTGHYSIGALPPGEYVLTISYNDVVLNSMDVSITSDMENTRDVFVIPGKLSGSVRYEDGAPTVNAEVVIYDVENNLHFSAQTDENGNYSMENILGGNFMIKCYANGYSSNIQRISVPIESTNVTRDLVVYPSSHLAGSLRLPDGTLVPDAKIRFSGFTDFVLTTDESGYFSEQIENDYYEIYADHTVGHSTYAIIDGVLLDDDMSLDIYLTYGTAVIGHVATRSGDNANNVPVYIEKLDTGKSISLYSNTNGDFKANLPKGSYLIQISSDNLVYYRTHEFTENSHSLDINLVEGITVNGQIAWRNAGLSDASVLFKDPSGHFEKAVTLADGTFGINLKPDIQYGVTISKLGFETINLGTHSANDLSGGIYEEMTALNMPITGTVYHEDDPLKDQNIILKFSSLNNESYVKEIQVGRDGNYSGYLPPDEYSVYFIQNVTKGNDFLVYEIDKKLALYTGLYDGRSLQINLEARLRQKFNLSITSPLSSVDYNASFKNGPEQVNFNVENGTGSFYIMPGHYILEAIYASNETMMVGMKDVVISETSADIYIDIDEAKIISGKLTYSGQGAPFEQIEFRDMHSNGTVYVNTDGSGSFEAIIEQHGDYRIIVDYVGYDESYEAYWYYTNMTIDSSSSSPLIIELEREEYYTLVTGNLSNRAAGVEMIFYSLEENFTTTSDSLGYFEIELRPGVYTAYVHDPFSNKVFLDIVVVDITKEPLNIEMEKGIRVFGTAYYNLNEHKITELNFQSNISLISISTDVNGFYEIWLPAGEYTVSSVVTAMNNDIPVLYTVNKTFSVMGREVQMNLPMSMVEHRDVVISFDEGQFTEVRTNTSVTYDFLVKNTGNIQDTFILQASGGNPEWVLDLSSEKVTIEAGVDAYSRVRVTAHISDSTTVTQNQITLVATSENDPAATYNAVMNLKIRQNYAMSIDPIAESPTFLNGVINSKFKVSNPGNGVDTFTLFIGNNHDLAKSGWKAEIGAVEGAELLDEGRKIVNVSIPAGGESIIPITLIPIDDNPARQASALISGYSQNQASAIDTQYITLRYPELQVYSGNTTIVGEEVSTVVAGDEIANAGVMIISVSVALGLFYYARKKRWIR